MTDTLRAAFFQSLDNAIENGHLDLVMLSDPDELIDDITTFDAAHEDADREQLFEFLHEYRAIYRTKH